MFDVKVVLDVKVVKEVKVEHHPRLPHPSSEVHQRECISKVELGLIADSSLSIQ